MQSYKLPLICMKIRSIYPLQKYQFLADRAPWVCFSTFQELFLVASDRNTVKFGRETAILPWIERAAINGWLPILPQTLYITNKSFNFPLP